MSRLCACQIGETAHRLLVPGACGQVLAGFSRAVYLVIEQAELFWLASENVPIHVRGLRIEGHVPQLVAGETFFVEGGSIQITPDLQVDFGHAPTWVMPPFPGNTVLEKDQIPARVKRLLSTDLNSSNASGFGRLIPRILSLATGRLDDKPEMDPMLAFAWPVINEIASACLRHDLPCLLQESKALVGLGEGFTPSGDDFVGGLLFCIHTMQGLYPGFIDLDYSKQASFIQSVKQRTHRISFTLLQDLANGHAVEPLHQWIQAVLSDQSPASSRQPASNLTQIGHSTGWDLLTGALTGLLFTFTSPELIDSLPLLPERDICI
jgi:hypothetical protein